MTTKLEGGEGELSGRTTKKRTCRKKSGLTPSSLVPTFFGGIFFRNPKEIFFLCGGPLKKIVVAASLCKFV